MLSQSRADAILDALDEIYDELFENGYTNACNQLILLQDAIVMTAERAANNTNPFEKEMK